jgi:hypothetical protein
LIKYDLSQFTHEDMVDGGYKIPYKKIAIWLGVTIAVSALVYIGYNYLTEPAMGPEEHKQYIIKKSIEEMNPEVYNFLSGGGVFVFNTRRKFLVFRDEKHAHHEFTIGLDHILSGVRPILNHGYIDAFAIPGYGTVPVNLTFSNKVNYSDDDAIKIQNILHDLTKQFHGA